MRLMYEITFKKHIRSIYLYYKNREHCVIDCLSALADWIIWRNWKRCIESIIRIRWHVYSIFGVIRDR